MPTFTASELDELALALEAHGLMVAAEDVPRIEKLRAKLDYLRTGRLRLRARPGTMLISVSKTHSSPLSSVPRIRKGVSKRLR